MKMKKNASTSSNIEKLHDNPKLKITKNNSLRFLKLHIMNLKIL